MPTRQVRRVSMTNGPALATFSGQRPRQGVWVRLGERPGPPEESFIFNVLLRQLDVVRDPSLAVRAESGADRTIGPVHAGHRGPARSILVGIGRAESRFSGPRPQAVAPRSIWRNCPKAMNPAPRYLIAAVLALVWASAAAGGWTLGPDLRDHAWTDSDGRELRLSTLRSPLIVVTMAYTACRR